MNLDDLGSSYADLSALGVELNRKKCKILKQCPKTSDESSRQALRCFPEYLAGVLRSTPDAKGQGETALWGCLRRHLAMLKQHCKNNGLNEPLSRIPCTK
jgi:hypothetical protein